MKNVLVPEGEQLHRALKWIDEEAIARPKVHLAQIVEEASVRFDLSPAEEEWLLRVIARPATGSRS